MKTAIQPKVKNSLIRALIGQRRKRWLHDLGLPPSPGGYLIPPEPAQHRRQATFGRPGDVEIRAQAEELRELVVDMRAKVEAKLDAAR